MSSALSRRVKALEPPDAVQADLARMTDADLAQAVVRSARGILDAPDAPERDRDLARRLLALPLDMPMDEWTGAEDDEFHALLKALKEDQGRSFVTP